MAIKAFYLSIKQIFILFINSDIKHTFGFQIRTEKKETEFMGIGLQRYMDFIIHI